MAPALPSIFSTPSSATRQVKKATSRLLMGPDWMLNMHICDSINTDPWQAHAFVKSVKKRLQNKSSRVQFLALMLLEAMVKNCGDFVHFQVVDQGILQEMVKIVRRTRNMQVREKILGLLQSWQESFDGPNGKYPQYYYTYAELKRSGVRFPQMQRNTELIVSSLTPTTNHPQVGYGMPSNTIERLDEVMASEMGHISLSDLENVQSVLELLTTMLQAVKPNDNTVGKDEVIIDLANQCRVNQKKVLRLINSSENDHLLGEALTLYDNLRAALAKYEALASGTPLPPGSSDCLPASSASSPAPSDAYQAQDKEEDEDGFSDLAKRHSMLKSTALEEVSPNLIDLSTGTTVTASSEAPSPAENSALSLFDPSVTVTSPKKTEATIDLFSLAFSTNQSPQTPQEPPLLNQNSFSNSSSFKNYPNTQHLITSNYSQPFISKEGYAISNSYVAPWAQPVIAQSWTSTSVSSNPFLPVEYAESQSIGPVAASFSVQDSQSSPIFSSVVSKDPQVNVDLKTTAPSAAPKPYMPDKLFDDLIELRNPDGSLKSRNASKLLSFKGTRNEKLQKMEI